MKTETHRAVFWQRNKKERTIFSSSYQKQTLSLQARQISFFPKKQNSLICAVRTLPCVFQKGSLTLEAAMILPVFLLAMLALFGYLLAYDKQLTMTEELLSTAEKAALYGTLSETGTGEGTYTKVYGFTSGVNFSGLGKLWLTAQVKVRPWTGYDGDLGDSDLGEAGELVYVSDNRSVYHTRADCSYLDIYLTSLPLSQVGTQRNDDGKKYTACDKCCGGSVSGTVYISGQGEHYHATLSCSGLSRSPEAVLRTSVSGLSLCTRCERRDSR